MDSVGHILRQRREAKNMSIEEIARATRVPMSSVERIESDQFDEFPGEVFVRGFLEILRASGGTGSRRNIGPIYGKSKDCVGDATSYREPFETDQVPSLRRRHRIRPFVHPLYARIEYSVEASRRRHATGIVTNIIGTEVQQARDLMLGPGRTIETDALVSETHTLC